MADFKKLTPFILQWEGGFANDPLDRGGATMAGVTIATWRLHGEDNDGDGDVDVDDLVRITPQQWEQIFKEQYWDKWKADRIDNQAIANILVDWAWASGAATSIKQVQRMLGVAVDGVVGPVTLNALNRRPPRDLFNDIKDRRLAFVKGIVSRDPPQQRFLKGWENRINALTF